MRFTYVRVRVRSARKRRGVGFRPRECVCKSGHDPTTIIRIAVALDCNVMDLVGAFDKSDLRALLPK